MKHLLYIISISILSLLVSSKQQPFKSSDSTSPHYQQFSPIGILDVGVGPEYRDRKRYLPLDRSSSLYTLENSHPLLFRGIKRTTPQHAKITRESIANAITQTRLSKYTSQSPTIAWEPREILVPDVTDLETVLTLAQIANNAYTEIPDTFDWIPVNGGWNLSSGFGWERNGIRGHVFASEGNETIIISLKGTSPAVFFGGGTGGNDKRNVCPFPVSSFPLTWRTVLMAF